MYLISYHPPLFRRYEIVGYIIQINDLRKVELAFQLIFVKFRFNYFQNPPKIIII